MNWKLVAQLSRFGLAMGIATSVWVTASHLLLFGSYIANHPSMPVPASPRLMMALVGPGGPRASNAAG
ncbi:MAG TPA: hypothetical protein VGJ83_00505 [Gemmatimonadales bacterium]